MSGSISNYTMHKATQSIDTCTELEGVIGQCNVGVVGGGGGHGFDFGGGDGGGGHGFAFGGGGGGRAFGGGGLFGVGLGHEGQARDRFRSREKMMDSRR